MKNFQRGTPAFGLFLGVIFLLAGALLLWLGIWKTLLLVVLFAAGYFLGAVGDKQSFVKETVDRVVPKKNEGTTINFREEVEKQQDAMYRASEEKTEAEPAEEEEASEPDPDEEEE